MKDRSEFVGGRYAVYYAPERGSGLARFGARWLGRCAETGERPAPPELSGFSPEDLRGLTSEPRRYGFHATLAAPFRLGPGLGGDDLMAEAGRFARSRGPVVLEPLSVREIGGFAALVPSGQKAVARLAADCVRCFHPLRRDPALAEIERRRARGLTPAQERLLVRWGYPYVFGEYRFHMTLTNSIVDKRVLRRLVRGVSELTAPLRREARAVRELCIFHQSGEGDPFTLVQRIPFGG